jgi:hypothetical protein
MKNNQIMTGFVALSALCAVTASAQVSYNNGDLLIGFRNGGTNDVVADLGPISNFQVAQAAPVTYSLGSSLTTVFGGVAGVRWSVFGVNDTTSFPFNGSVSQSSPYTLWTSSARGNAAVQSSAPFVASAPSQNLVLNDIATIASSTVAGSGSPITALATGVDVIINTTGFGYSPSIGTDGNFNGDYRYNIENTGAGTSDLYQSNPGNRFSQQADYLGNFVLDSAGNVTFNAVPEPSAYALVTSGLVALAALGRFRNRQ